MRHRAGVRHEGQYRTLVIPQDGDQAAVVQGALDDVLLGFHPIVVPFGPDESKFWDAEDYHQKYRLRRNQAVVPMLGRLFGPRWDQHSLATKLNAASVAGMELAPWLDPLTPEMQRAFRRG